jgi:1-acyl-sn-glycerol-3-phosphate acyltransferase
MAALPAETGLGGRIIRAAWRAYCRLLFYGLLAIFAVTSLCWSALAAVLELVLPRRIALTIGRFMIGLGFRIAVGLMTKSGLIACDFRALDRLKAETGLIVAANHPGRLDAVLLGSRLRNVVCIIKADLWQSLIFGGGARLAGYIRNDTPMEMIRSAARDVRGGANLLIFPEGTRSSRASLNRFSGGFALIAQFAGAPIQTVFIENVSGFLEKGWPIFRMPEFPITFRIRLGRRLEAPRDPAHFAAELEAYFRTELAIETGATA